MINRVKFFISWLKSNRYIKSQKDFGVKIGSDNESYTSQILANEEKLKNFIPKIKDLFPMLNEDWLLTGNGDMLTSNNSQISVKIENSAISQVDSATNCTFNNNAYQRPNDYDFDSEENILGCPDGVLIPVDMRTIPNNVRLRDYCLNKNDHDTDKKSLEGKVVVKYRIRTNLLWPRLFKGDLIIAYLVKDKSNLVNGRCYLVDCPVHGKMVKRLFIHETNYRLDLPDPKPNYSILEIPKDHAEEVDFYEIVSRVSTDLDSVFCEDTYNYQALAHKLADNEQRLIAILESLANNKT